MDRLRSFLDLERGEEALAFLLFAYLALVITSYMITRTVRDGLFLYKFSAYSLPYVCLGIAAIIGFAVSVYVRFSACVGQAAVISGSLLFFVGNILLQWGAVRVEKLGFEYVHIPLDAWDPVSDQALKTFCTVVNTPAYQPVFVHCKRGSDRTGVMIGFYRIAIQGWTADRAYREARALGMSWWHRGLKRQLYDFADGRSTLRIPAPIQVGSHWRCNLLRVSVIFGSG